MSSAREMRRRIKSVKSLAQITKALETVSASKVKKAIQAVEMTRPYAEKAWKVLVHLARQPGHTNLHPLLAERKEIKQVLVVMISSDQGLAGSYNINILRKTLETFEDFSVEVDYLAIGKKGRDLLVRRRKKVIAEFSNLPLHIEFRDVSAIGRLVVDDFIDRKYDQIYLSYTDYLSMSRQETVVRKLLPLEVQYSESRVKNFNVTHHKSNAVFTYEPDSDEILDQIVSRFTSIQIYQAILTSMASEHAARMIAMRNATDNARELSNDLQLAYNKIRQQSITNDILDIASGANALNAVQVEPERYG